MFMPLPINRLPKGGCNFHKPKKEKGRNDINEQISFGHYINIQLLRSMMVIRSIYKEQLETVLSLSFVFSGFFF